MVCHYFIFCFFWQLVLISFYMSVIIFKMYQSCCYFKHWKSIIMKWNMLISKFWCHRERERGKEVGGERERERFCSCSVLFPQTCSVLIGFCSIQLNPCFGFYVVIFVSFMNSIFLQVVLCATKNPHTFNFMKLFNSMLTSIMGYLSSCQLAW